MVQSSITGSQGLGRAGVQIYEALDPLSGNPLLMEMRRRIEAAEELSSRRSSAVTAREIGSDQASVHRHRSEHVPEVRNVQHSLTIGSDLQVVVSGDSRGRPRDLPPLPIRGSMSQGSTGTFDQVNVRGGFFIY